MDEAGYSRERDKVGSDRVARLRGDVTKLESGQLLRHHHWSLRGGG